MYSYTKCYKNTAAYINRVPEEHKGHQNLLLQVFSAPENSYSECYDILTGSNNSGIKAGKCALSILKDTTGHVHPSTLSQHTCSTFPTKLQAS